MKEQQNILKEQSECFQRNESDNCEGRLHEALTVKRIFSLVFAGENEEALKQKSESCERGNQNF